jgi:hypothetical protein
MYNKHKKYAGRGMHEIYLPTTGKGIVGRRSRKKCRHHNASTGWCHIIFNNCVGPSICGKYEDVSKETNSLLHKTIYNKYFGEGVVISVSEDICTIQYKERKVQIKKEDLEQSLKD